MPPQKPRRKRLAYGLPYSTEAILATASEVQRLMAPGVNPDGSLKPEAIRALLKVKGVNLKALAELHGKFDTYFHAVIMRENHDELVENIIAAALGMDADRIWGRRSVEQTA